MRKGFLCVLLITNLFLLLQSENIKVLLVIPDRYGANTNLTMESLDYYGWDYTTAGVNQIIQPCPYTPPMGMQSITVDVLISEIDNIETYDCMIITSMSWISNSSSAYSDLLNSQDALNLISAANDAGVIIYATCAGVRVLAAADILDGVYVTGRTEFSNEYTAAGAIFLGGQLKPVIDGNIVTTTRGQYYAIPNMQAVMTAIASSYSSRSQGGE